MSQVPMARVERPCVWATLSAFIREGRLLSSHNVREGGVCSPLSKSRSWSKRTIVAVVPSGTFNFNSLSVISTLMAPDGVDIGGESVLHVSSCVVSDCLKDMEQMALMTGHSADAELLRKGYPYRKVAKLTNVSESTVKRLKKEFCI